MNILVLVDEEIGDSLRYWLHTQGHQSHHEPAKACQKLVLDYAHLKPYLWTQQPIPDSWPEPKHWLLLDAYLDHTQLIAAIHIGCKHISLAPIQSTHLQQWLDARPQIQNLSCTWPQKHELTPSEDSMLIPFIDCIMDGIWCKNTRASAAAAMLWRNVALESEPYQSLAKINKLDAMEFSQLAYHTLAGGAFLQDKGLRKAATIANQHHEHWDGSGYPEGIAGEDICIEARLAKLYDSYIGLRKNKVYAKACDHRASINKMTYGDGYLDPNHFDPLLLKRFLGAEKNIEQLYSLGFPAN